jgi:NAD(P)-dependent dehydrogenase (short-subunit alcohol dehydrogenase family)
MGRVQDKVILITGAASDPGLGHCAALALGREGGKLLVTDIDGAGAEACAQKIRDAGGEALALAQDVTSEAGWEEAISLSVSHYGRLDVLVNNAGIAVLKPLEALTLDDWNRQIAVNLTSVFLGCRAAVPALRSAGGGAIINMSSVTGLIGLPAAGAYAASKGGVRMMSKAIAAEFGKENIRCNSVHPGVILTNMQANAGFGTGDRAQAVAAMLPLRRLGDPSDIAHCIVYLSSDEAAYVTGAEFVIDAGMTAT